MNVKTPIKPIRHWEISEKLENDIKIGHYPIGTFLPTEEKLCEVFGASRHSMRQALSYLVTSGLISRKARAGSLVIATTSIPQLVQSVGSIQQLLNYPGETSREIFDTSYIEADFNLASLLNCSVGESWFLIQSLRYPKGYPVPICITKIYLRPEYAGVIKHKNKFIPVADQISEMYGEVADETQIDITATTLSPFEAGQLKTKKAAPALTVTRRYANKLGKIFEVGIATHPADRYTYSFHFKRDELLKK
jgi:DNA-binding GntR family transcriptional regulator